MAETENEDVVPLKVVMRDVARVVDSMNRDRSFDLAQKAQTVLAALSALDSQLSDYGYEDWFVLPPGEWDEGWGEAAVSATEPRK